MKHERLSDLGWWLCLDDWRRSKSEDRDSQKSEISYKE